MLTTYLGINGKLNLPKKGVRYSDDIYNRSVTEVARNQLSKIVNDRAFASTIYLICNLI